jgi:hypothetical protein
MDGFVVRGCIRSYLQIFLQIRYSFCTLLLCRIYPGLVPNSVGSGRHLIIIKCFSFFQGVPMPENQNVEYKSSLIRVLILLVIMGSSAFL